MAINPIQIKFDKNLTFKNDTSKSKSSYLNATGAINTDTNVHPLPPKGHLIHDSFANKVKYYFKDLGYDFKSLKNGIKGTANDHQSGRLNDIGLVTAGVLIATYLASKTTNPKARIMEYVGLTAFLTAMSIYPKFAINTPAKLMHGYDIDKEYIDDQGRKKSVMQDSNYVPYDMYLGEFPEEDLQVIGDKMGIPRDIKNRNDLIREQMRKIATQNNTLWMLTAGITPAIAGLLCCGLENYVVGPALEKAGIAHYDKLVKKALETTQSMNSDIKAIQPNKLSNEVKALLSSYKGQELPEQEFENLLKILNKGLFENTSEGMKEDLIRIFETSAGNGSKSYVVNNDTAQELVSVAQNTITKRNKAKLEGALVPTAEEFESILRRFTPADGNFSKGTTMKAENLMDFKKAVRELLNTKSRSIENVPEGFLEIQKQQILEAISKNLKVKKSMFVSEGSIDLVSDFAKVLGEFKANKSILEECTRFNIEHTNETVLARSYEKFEKTLLDILNIKHNELRKVRESETYAKELLDKKFAEIAKDDKKFTEAIDKLAKVISEMEIKLNGKDNDSSRLVDLINSIQANYNKTAERLHELGSFRSTINRLVKEDVTTAEFKAHKKLFASRQELFDFLDGIEPNKYKELFFGKDWGKLSNEEAYNFLKESSNGIGSSKNMEITRILERYQGVKNSFHRVLHSLDIYRRANNPESFAANLTGKRPDYIEAVIAKAKETLLSATPAEHNVKLGTVNNPSFYKELMNAVWASESGVYWSTKEKGFLTSTTKETLGKYNELGAGNLLDRIQYYLTRFRNIIANSTIDFTKPEHILNEYVPKEYQEAARTRMSIFNLVGQSPSEMLKGAAGKRYATQKWVRMISGITAGVIGVAGLAQLAFGKISNPQNVQKQVNDDSNK